MNLLSAHGFSEAVGITRRAAQLAFRNATEGKTWRGHSLPVAELAGQRGGSGGSAKHLILDMASPELKALLNLPETPPSTVPSTHPEPRLTTRPDEAHFAVALDKQAIIAPILKAARYSTERAELIRATSEREQISDRTLREWVQAFENGGVAALLPVARRDRGKARVLVSRAWDRAIDLPEATKAKLAARIEREARSMIANDGTSAREATRLSGDNLARYCASEGSDLPRNVLQTLCKLNKAWAKRSNIEGFRLVYQHDKDHGTYQDKAVPRIRRELHALPLGLLIGDVHYVDLLVEDQAEPVRVRLIAWMDAASMFAWVTPVFLPKGKGVRQEDVAEALSQVALCPHGGIPQEYYLDNGSEYKALADAMVRLSTLADMSFNVTLAKPYSPTSKGEIEGFFNVLEGIFKGLPGWIGGDRTNKKSENKGKVVAPYRKGLAALEEDIRAAVAIYNNRPQSGRLDGLSPLDMLERKIAETGFVARVPSAEAFDLIFSKADTRVIRQGAINFGGRQWHTPAIDHLPVGAAVEIRSPLRKQRERLFVRHESKDLGWAEPLPVFQHGDREGARLQARLERGRKDAVCGLKAQVDPDVSTFDLQKQGVDRIAPNAPAPENWSYAIDKTAASTVAELEAEENAASQALINELRTVRGLTSREASGGNR